MNAPASEGYVLSREHRGEHFLLLTLLSPQGLIRPMLRLPGKKQIKAPPDLFDRIEWVFEPKASGSDGPLFMRDWRLLNHYSGLARHYNGLLHATELSRLIMTHGPHMADGQAAYRVLERALPAWADGAEAGAVLFKALYLLARDEGYPVKEQWWARLSSNEQHQARALINRPLDANPLPPAEVETLLNRLRHWMQTETDLG